MTEPNERALCFVSLLGTIVSKLLPALLFLSTSARAMTFEVEYTDNRPLFPPALWVSMSGEIEIGDTARFQQTIAPYLDHDIREVAIRIDSPGGRLSEGMELGRAISSLPYHTRITVGTEGGSNECASACVLAYLGADYRFLNDTARIGVHQFSTSAELRSDEAMSISQTVSAEIVEYITEMRADPEFFSLMVSARADEIYWVPTPRLEELWVVTYGIYSESAEYENIEGSVALHIEQVSQAGSNSLTMVCGEEGLVTIFSLNEPEGALFTQFELVVDGATYPLDDSVVLSREEFRLHTAHLLPSTVQRRLENARGIGARASHPDVGVFFGFQGSVKDPKIAEMSKGCATKLSNAAPRMPRMTEITDFDFTGGDLTRNGIRNISFEACQRMCIEDRLCQAVSYVVSQRWCWPKQTIVGINRKAGVNSAYFK